MHPQNLARRETSYAFDGTPIAKYHITIMLDEGKVERVCWEHNEKRALKAACRAYPDAVAIFLE